MGERSGINSILFSIVGWGALVFSGIGFLCTDAFAASPTIRISNLSDITISNWITGDSDIIQDVDVCVYKEDVTLSNRNYDLMATGDGPGFILKNGSYNLPYSVFWYDGGEGNPGGGSTHALTSASQVTSLHNSRIDTDVPTSSNDCNVGAVPTARFRVKILATDLDAVPEGTYTGQLSVVVAPE
ncbi:MAG: hypothetical protein IPP74_00960 [Alphaproteobacteria bacterium]|nr:hypothetical protein [Alphaproteobacteria bacterium]